MLNDLDAMIAAARKRLFKSIERRCELFRAGGDKAKWNFAARSIGQRYRRLAEREK